MTKSDFGLGSIVSLAFTLAITYFLVRLAFDIFVGGSSKEGFDNGRVSWDGDTLRLNGNVIVNGMVTVPKVFYSSKAGTPGNVPRWSIEPEGPDDFYLVMRDNASNDKRYALYGDTYTNL